MPAISSNNYSCTFLFVISASVICKNCMQLLPARYTCSAELESADLGRVTNGKSGKIAKVIESHGKVMENKHNVMNFVEFLPLHLLDSAGTSSWNCHC